jgi:hypothetical protein
VVGALARGHRRMGLREASGARAARSLVPPRERRFCPGPHDGVLALSPSLWPSLRRARERQVLRPTVRSQPWRKRYRWERRDAPCRPAGVSSAGWPRGSLACIASSDPFASLVPSIHPTVRVLPCPERGFTRTTVRVV